MEMQKYKNRINKYIYKKQKYEETNKQQIIK